MNRFKILFTFLISTFTLSSFAGWGAIAFNQWTGQSAEAHGYATYYDATYVALSYCGPGCSIVSTELNSCIALATGYGRWGVSQPTFDIWSASNQATYNCGYGCGVRTWTCN